MGRLRSLGKRRVKDSFMGTAACNMQQGDPLLLYNHR